MNGNNTTPAQEPEISETEAEIIKALAYGFSPEEIAVAEDVTAEDVTRILHSHWSEIETAHDTLVMGGYYNVD